jgi:hypothetical protein
MFVKVCGGTDLFTRWSVREQGEDGSVLVFVHGAASFQIAIRLQTSADNDGGKWK